MFPVELTEHSRGKKGLTVPRRPKWRYEMTKKEVEMNEEGVFKKWLDGCDSVVADWREEGEQIERDKKEIQKRREKGEEISPEEDLGNDEDTFDWPRSTGAPFPASLGSEGFRSAQSLTRCPCLPMQSSSSAIFKFGVNSGVQLRCRRSCSS